MKKIIYLDNNATTKVAPEVVEEMVPFFSNFYGNPSSIHSFGGQVYKYIQKARESVAELLNASSNEIIFTSCGTEGDNAAIMGTLNSYPEKRHIITTKVEHPAVKELCASLKRSGYSLTELSVNNEGMLDLSELRASINENTAIVSIMWANNETGVIFPIKEIAEIVKNAGVVFHVDAVQSAGKIPINLQDIPIDLLVISGHKIHAPKGVGALFVRRGTKFRPFIIGGHQERNRRAGTENVASIVGLGKASELALKNIEIENTYVKKLRDKLETQILKTIPKTLLNGNKNNRLPNTVNISFKFIEGEAILLLLDELGICASSGSACTSGSLEPSHVLRAMGIPYTAAHGSVRFSLSTYNVEEEIDFVLEKLPAIIERLRAISPYDGSEGEE